MFQAHTKHGADVVVGKLIKNGLALAAKIHQLGGAQNAQLMRDGGERHPQKRGDIANAKLVLQKHVEDLDARAVAKDLEKLGKAFDYEYLEGRKSGDMSRSQYYSPEHSERLSKIGEITEYGRKLIADHYNSEFRIRTVSVRLLEKHAKFADLLAAALVPKAVGNDDLADELLKKMKLEMGKEEAFIQSCYDHGLAFYALDMIFSRRTRDVGPIIY